ncbi:hypothetical protein N2152v2_001901 [Parachlorella kessleri]
MELAIGALLLNIPGDFVETGVCEGGLPEGTGHDPPPRHRKSWRGEFSSSEQRFIANLQRFRVPVGRVRVLRGWFNETLQRADITSIAYLRLDADLYASTMDALEALYDKVSIGGLVYVDDYNSFPGCKAAVDEFRRPQLDLLRIRQAMQATTDELVRVAPALSSMCRAAVRELDPQNDLEIVRLRTTKQREVMVVYNEEYLIIALQDIAAMQHP